MKDNENENSVEYAPGGIVASIEAQPEYIESIINALRSADPAGLKTAIESTPYVEYVNHPVFAAAVYLCGGPAVIDSLARATHFIATPAWCTKVLQLMHNQVTHSKYALDYVDTDELGFDVTAGRYFHAHVLNAANNMPVESVKEWLECDIDRVMGDGIRYEHLSLIASGRLDGVQVVVWLLNNNGRRASINKVLECMSGDTSALRSLIPVATHAGRKKVVKDLKKRLGSDTPKSHEEELLEAYLETRKTHKKLAFDCRAKGDEKGYHAHDDFQRAIKKLVNTGVFGTTGTKITMQYVETDHDPMFKYIDKWLEMIKEQGEE